MRRCDQLHVCQWERNVSELINTAPRRLIRRRMRCTIPPPRFAGWLADEPLVSPSSFSSFSSLLSENNAYLPNARVTRSFFSYRDSHPAWEKSLSFSCPGHAEKEQTRAFLLLLLEESIANGQRLVKGQRPIDQSRREASLGSSFFSTAHSGCLFFVQRHLQVIR